MKTTHIISIAAIIALAVSMPRAQHLDAGTVAFPFLNQAYDARSVAMAGAAIAMPNDIYGVLSNPAAVGYAGRTQIMGGYRQIMMDVWGGPLGLSIQTRAAGGMVLAPHLISLTTGDFEVIDENNMETGRRARSSYTAGGITAAMTFYDGGLSAGATLKGIYHYLDDGLDSYSADGFALDCGVLGKANNGRLTYGAALRNFGFVRSGYLGGWSEYEMPYGVEAGASYIPRHIPNLRLAADVNKYNGDYMNFEPAFEYTVLANTLFLRGGYAFSTEDFGKLMEVFKGERDDTYQKSSVSTLSLGVGVAGAMDNVNIRLDAAMQFNSDVAGPSVVVSLAVVF